MEKEKIKFLLGFRLSRQLRVDAACGIPVLTLENGGSPEIIDETCGSAVPCNGIDAMKAEMRRICTTKPYSTGVCLERAKRFAMHEKFEEYVELFEVQNESF